VIRQEPADKSGYLRRANTYIQAQEYDKALADCNRVLQLDPQNSEAFMTRAIVYNRKGDKARAGEDIERGLELSRKLSKSENSAQEALQNGKSFFDKRDFDAASLRAQGQL
jgi:Tfp pilus assembly protein PilF